jgi:hypothetical protein
MKEVIQFSLIFVFCFLLQVVVLPNFYGPFWFQPFPYLFFILYFSPNIPKWASVLLAFSVGFLFDWFLNSYGIHASATLLIGLLKPYVALGNISPAPTREEEKGSWLHKGKARFKYLFLLSFIALHHFWVFLMEMMGSNFGSSFVPTWIGSTFATFFLILIADELFFVTFRRKV